MRQPSHHDLQIADLQTHARLGRWIAAIVITLLLGASVTWSGSCAASALSRLEELEKARAADGERWRAMQRDLNRIEETLNRVWGALGSAVTSASPTVVPGRTGKP